MRRRWLPMLDTEESVTALLRDKSVEWEKNDDRAGGEVYGEGGAAKRDS